MTRGLEKATSIQSFALPKLSVFEDGGVLVGDLRDPWDKATLRAETLNNFAAIVTTNDIELTAERPCAEAGARMLIASPLGPKSWSARTQHVWDFNRVLGYPVKSLAQPNRLGAVRGSLVIRALALSDIGNPLTTTDELAARQDPGNPLNRISGDLKTAQALPAEGPNRRGNLRLCLSKEIDEADFTTVTVPPELVFESYGRLVGDLRDPKGDEDYMLNDRKTSYGLITIRSTVLTKAKPCATIAVRSVLSADWPWLFPLVREADHLHFQGLKIRGFNGMNDKLPGHVGDALNMGILNATPVADIGNPMDLGAFSP
jgi:hypothetical protein